MVNTTLGPCGECYNCVCIKYHMILKSSCCSAPLQTGRFIDGKQVSDEEVTKRLVAVKSNSSNEKESNKSFSQWNQIQFRDICSNCGNLCNYVSKHQEVI